MLKLVIGNRNYSSWSLRAWLYMAESHLDFDEVRIPMFSDTWAEEVAKFTPAGRVPVLVDGEIAVWDSLAIIHHLYESFPDSVGWPRDPVAMAHARSISAEMHSGFIAIRGELPQNIRKRCIIPRSKLTAGCNAQIERVVQIWEQCRKTYSVGGPWLFGQFSIADVMFAPIVLRFQTYGISVSARAAEFTDAVINLETVKEWSRGAAEEVESIDFIDDLVPATESPLTLG